MVSRLEREPDEVLGDWQLAVAALVEHGFHLVRELGDRIVAEHAR
jgi:hypothetical protein